MSDLPASRPARPGVPRHAESPQKSKTSFGCQAWAERTRAKILRMPIVFQREDPSTEVTIAMAQLSSILGGKPGRPGDMMRGIPPRPPRPPKAPEPPRPPKPPKPVWQRKSDSRGDKANEDQDRDHQEEHTRE